MRGMCLRGGREGLRVEWRESRDLGNLVCHYFFGSRPKSSDQVGCTTRIKPSNIAEAENEHVTRLPLSFPKAPVVKPARLIGAVLQVPGLSLRVPLYYPHLAGEKREVQEG